MYETYLHKTSKDFLAFSQAHVKESDRAVDMVGWKGALNFLRLDHDLALLYQLVKADDGWTVSDLHMLFWGAEKNLRKDICRIGKFWKTDGTNLWNPEGNILWHASLDYSGRRDLTFVVANAWMTEPFEKYSEGGNFEMTFSGIGTWMECLNDRSVIRFHSGNPVERARLERNDPTIDHEDMDMSELRSLNSGDSDEEPALAEFTGVIDACEKVQIAGEKCYRIRLWSGPAEWSSSFPWDLLIAACRIDGHYVPRVGDIVHGNAVMFGTFHGEAQTEPTLFDENRILENETPESVESSADEVQEDVPEEKASVQQDWEYLPRKAAPYPDVVNHGKGLAADVRKVMPKFVTYAAYKKSMKGELKSLREPSRKALRQILDSIDYVITSDGNRHVFAKVFDAIGIRHFVEDGVTGERHLWCCLPSGFGQEHFLTNLLVALAPSGEVLRYTFHMGEWDWRRLYHGLVIDVTFQKAKNEASYEKMSEAIAVVDKMVEDDFLIASERGHTVMVQAYCDTVKDGCQQFTVEWQAHYLPWQFYAHKVSAEKLKQILATFDAEGIESVETMLTWHWCKMKGNT